MKDSAPDQHLHDDRAGTPFPLSRVFAGAGQSPNGDAVAPVPDAADAASAAARPVTMQTNRRTWLLLALLLNVALSIWLLWTPGTTDLQVYLRWAHAIEQHGFTEGFVQSETDYPLIGLALLVGADSAGHTLGLGVQDDKAIRILSLLGLFLGSALFYALTRDLLATTALQWALTLNSAAMGYSDSLVIPPLILCLWAVRRRNIMPAVLCFIVACLIKWQPVILAPFIALYLLDLRDLHGLRTVKWRPLLVWGLLPAALLIGIMYLITGPALVLSLGEAMRVKLLSGNALNFAWIMTAILHIADPGHYGGLSSTLGLVKYIRIEHDSSPLFFLPKLLFLAGYLLLLYRFFRSPKTFAYLLCYALFGYLVYFTFNTEVHENHLFLACVLAALLAHLIKSSWPVFVACALAANINLVLFYGLDGRTTPVWRVINGIDLSIPFAVLFTVGFTLIFLTFIFRNRELWRTRLVGHVWADL